MSKENKTSKTVIEEGAKVPEMQKVVVPFEKGASIPQMQPVTQPASSPQSGTNQGNDSQGPATSNNDKKK